MVIKISRKVKFGFIVFFGLLATLLTYTYQRIVGGKAMALPGNKFVVGGKNTVSVLPIAAVARNENIAAGIDEVVKKMGDLDFIKSGQKVLIKPNVNSDDPAPATTHPEALAELVRLVKAKGAYVIVGDRSNARWETLEAMKITGMYDAAKKAWADEIVGFENEEWVRISPENAKDWPNGFRVPKRLFEVDHIISMPVLHTHMIAGHSLAIKNLVGLIHPEDRMLFHISPNIQNMIAEISLAIKPSLTVIDGTKAFIEGGPSEGKIAQTQVYLASKDTLAADVLGVQLLIKNGAKLKYEDVWESDQIKHFQNLGLSQYTLAEINKESVRLIQ